MSAPDFTSILNETVESVERPALPPLGTYVMSIPTVPKMDSRDRWDVIDIAVKGVSIGDDVDPDLMKAYGAVSSVTARISFMFDKEDKAAFEQTHFRLKTFLENHLGIDPKLTLKEALNAAVNKQCLVEISYRADKNDPSIMYTNVKRTAPLN